MLRMLLQSRRYACLFVFRRLKDFANPPKVPNPYGAGYRGGGAERRQYNLQQEIL